MRRASTWIEAIVVIAIIGILVALLFPVVTAIRSKQTKTADQHQAEQTRQMLAEADRQVGMPDITKFTERKLARDILELRDDEITTYCYIVNLDGDLIFIGEAIGFGLPYSVQYTNPEKMTRWNHGAARGIERMAQADPNGLFMPQGLAATWIMLKGPDGNVHPVYMEPEIIVSPFPLHDQVKAEIEG